MKCPCSAAITAEKKIKPSGREYIYYRCTKKKGPCQEKHFLREEILIEQIKTYLQKVSLSSQNAEKVLAELEKDELKAKEETKILVQNLKKELAEIETKLEKLLDVYLNEIISTEEYTARKQKILTQKLELQERIRDFEQKGLSWLEPAREFVLKLNYAEKLLNSENYPEMKTFLKNIGSNHILRNQKLIFSFKFPFNLAAEPRSGEAETLTYPKWWAWRDSNPRPFGYKPNALPLSYTPPKVGYTKLSFLSIWRIPAFQWFLFLLIPWLFAPVFFCFQKDFFLLSGKRCQ